MAVYGIEFVPYIAQSAAKIHLKSLGGGKTDGMAGSTTWASDPGAMEWEYT